MVILITKWAQHLMNAYRKLAYRLCRFRFGFLCPLIHSSAEAARDSMTRTAHNHFLLHLLLSLRWQLRFCRARAESPRRPSAPQTGAPAPKNASQQFKNIQILKDVPADQLDPRYAIHHRLAGVDCDIATSNTRSIRRQKAQSDGAQNDGNDDHHQQRKFRSHRMVTCYTATRAAPVR